MIRGCEIEGVEAIGDVDARCRLRDRRQRPWELLLSFESDRPLCEAAAEVAEQGISHLALFVSDGHARTQWLAELADATDTYAVCAPSLERPAPPSGPVYCDHVIF